MLVQPGFSYHPDWLTPAEQARLLADLRAAADELGWFTPTMPRWGTPFSVKMLNFGPLGWVSDKSGYRYQPHHPVNGAPWPAMPDLVQKAWQDLAEYPHPAEACLVNYYAAGAKMGLHQDKDEADFTAPVVSLSLGDSAIFRIGTSERNGPTQSIKLHSGDALVFGGPARLAFHGIDRIIGGTSRLLPEGGRINLTLRRVTKPAA